MIDFVKRWRWTILMCCVVPIAAAFIVLELLALWKYVTS